MRLIVFIFAITVFFSCKEKKEEVPPSEEVPSVVLVTEAKYPKEFIKVLDAHGGLDTWKSKRTLTFELPKADILEKHTIDLYSRKDKIETPEVTIGFDGAAVWLLDSKATFKGDALFYHNLMFYFYAMPFVLADDGITYAETEPLEFEGKSYPGLKISYEEGVGVSSKDEYFVHYDPETYQMAWLGYTVTYRSGEKSDTVKWIRYTDWITVEGVVLPNSISWFEYEGRTLKAPRNTMKFENVALQQISKSDDFYARPSNAKVVTKE